MTYFLKNGVFASQSQASIDAANVVKALPAALFGEVAGDWATVGLIGLLALSFYIQVTQCWFKPVGKMPGYCLMVFR